MRFLALWMFLWLVPCVRAQTPPETPPQPPAVLQEEKPKPRWAKFASREGNLVFLSAALLLPLATDGRQGMNRSLRGADSLATSVFLTEGLKLLTHERRPDGSTDSYSFPSGHAAAAFAVAAYRSRYHPAESVFWYAGAAAIAYSRIALNRHRARDVVAGAILGTGTAAWETSARRGLVISPVVTVDKENRLSVGFGGTF